MHLAILDELILLYIRLELVVVDEVVVDTVDLTGTRSTRGERHTEAKPVGVLLGQLGNECAFARSRRPDNHERLVLLPVSL